MSATCEFLDCSVIISATKNKSGLCKAHYNAERGTGHIRNARLRGLFVEVVLRSEVWCRSEGICHLCLRPIVGAWEMDHIIPIAERGPHCYANVAAACMSCNRSKNNRLAPSSLMGQAMAAFQAFHSGDLKPTERVCSAEGCGGFVHRSLNRSGLCRVHQNRTRALTYYYDNRDEVLAKEYAARGPRSTCSTPECHTVLRSHNKTGLCRDHRPTTLAGRLGETVPVKQES